MAESDEKPPAVPISRLGRFIERYHTFLSTFVIGAAGLIATSIWQFKQSEIARRQADSQQQIAKTQAENQWRIERAEILSKNLQVLASRGAGSAEQRYGVLLSLTRGEILDPELAVSYALELGKDNPDYMKSVLASTSDKDYLQLSHAFSLTCDQRFGLTRQTEACKGDDQSPRAQAIAELVSDDVDLWATLPAATASAATSAGNPLSLLVDERQVVKDPWRMVGFFGPSIVTLYQKNQWTELGRIEGTSQGAHLITALVVATARTGERPTEAATAFHEVEKKWLLGYLAGRTCDPDCRSRLADLMLTGLVSAQGDFHDALKLLLSAPPADAAPTIERLHTRLLRCQVDQPELEALRDEILVPILLGQIEGGKVDTSVLEDVADLLTLVPDPTEPIALANFSGVVARVQKALPDKKKGALSIDERRAAAEQQMKNPPAALRKVSFCKALDVETAPAQP